MAGQPFVVIRLVPESPIDGTTFSTYLDDPLLQLVDAYSGKTLSKQTFSSPLAVFQWLLGSGYYLAITSTATLPPTSFDEEKKDYGNVLTLNSTNGISVGSVVLSADQTTIPASANDNEGLQVNRDSR